MMDQNIFLERFALKNTHLQPIKYLGAAHKLKGDRSWKYDFFCLSASDFAPPWHGKGILL